MKNTGKHWLRRTILAGAVLVSATGWAMGPPGGMDRDPGRMMEHMSAKLDLSAEQEAEVKSLMAASREANAEAQRRLGELQGQLQDMRADFDAGKAQQIADEIGELTAGLVYRMSSTWAGVYQLLDTDQRAEMDALMAQREERRGKWHKTGPRSGGTQGG